jgi:uncharacterized protein
MLLVDPWLLALFNLGIGMILGSILFRSDFCMAGILRDVFLFGDRTLLNALFLAVILTMFLFLLGRLFGLLAFDPLPTFGPPSLTGLLGGLLFGVGMVLAGGCVVSTLYKMAGGNLAHGLAFVGIIVGSLLYAEVHPLFKVAEGLTSLGEAVTLFQVWPRAAEAAVWLLTGGAGLIFLRWQRQGKWQVVAGCQGYMQPWRVAIALALLNLAVYFFSGWPIGISTAYAKMGAWIESLFFSDHVANLAYFNQPTVMMKVAGRTLIGGASPSIDLIFNTELMLMLGIVSGAFLTALRLGEFRIYGLPPLHQGLATFAGGLLIAIGARMANGCNIKHVLGGLPLLSLQSLLFVGGLLVGAWLGARLLPKIILR